MLKKSICFALILSMSMAWGMHVGAEDEIPNMDRINILSEISTMELESHVDDYMERYINISTIGAAVVITKDQQVLLSKGYGYADMEKSTPVDSKETVFEWGSISKLMVWTSAMQLVEKGQLDLQADIKDYLPPNFMTKLKYTTPITMTNLMNHNAGFEEYMFDMSYTSPLRIRSLEEGLRLAEPAQVYEPGEVVAYSNYSTSLAAFVVEQITGQDFHDYVKENILLRLNMHNTTSDSVLQDRSDMLEHKAKGYVWTGESFIPSSFNYMSLYPSGGFNGTAEDLAKFALSFIPTQKEQPLLFENPDTLEQIIMPTHKVNPYVPGIAHGFWEYNTSKRGIGHGGNTIAFSSNLLIVPEDNLSIIILTNQAAETDVTYGLLNFLVGKQSSNVEENIPSSVKMLEGQYISARRAHHGFMSLYPYLSLLKVTPIESNKMQVTLLGMTGEYIETKPFVFEKISGDSGLDIWPVLYFDVEDKKVNKISAYTSDYLPLPADKSPLLLLTYAVLAGFVVLFFALAPLGLAIRSISQHKKIKNKNGDKSKVNTWILLLTLSGTGILINNIILVLRMLSNYERAFSEIVIHTALNTIFSMASMIFMLLLILSWQKKKAVSTLGQKIMLSLSLFSTFILMFLLSIWQFY